MTPPGASEPLIGRWREAGGDPDALPAPVRDALPAVFAASDFVLESASREPGLIAGLAASGALGRARAPGEVEAIASGLVAAHDDEPAFMDALRRLRRHELVRIAWRDLAGLATLDETLRELSTLADGAIRAALDFATRALAPRYGTPRSAAGEAQELVVIGMGKLGGGELNFSSDIDLVFLYPERGETDGPRGVSNEEYFTRIGQSLIRLLDARTAEGFVFRVDMRLRPLGEPGPLAMNFGAFEDYLQQHGRDWERYAWVKARAVTGGARFGALYDDVVRPFVYRRYLDYGVYESLREMKAMIAREVERRELRDNVKLGPGGIREIEFIVQSQQLIRGGSEPGLRTPSLQAALPRLAGAKLLPPAAVTELAEAYAFLRRVENRLQMAEDAQTHALPEDEAGRARLAASMGFPDWNAFHAALGARREAVTARFDDVVLGRGGPGQPPPAALFESLWSPEASLERVAEDVRRTGLADPEAAARVLLELRQSAYFRRLDEFGRRRLATLLPRVLAAVARVEAGAAGPGLSVLTRLVRIVEAIGGRTAYLALLNENAQALERLVQACSMGDYLARQVAAHPLLLDELLDARVLETLPDRAQFAEELAARLEHAGTDEELRVDALRHFRRAATFRIAMLDLTGRLPLMQVSDRLTDVAELIIEQALALAWRHTVDLYGEPRCADAAGTRMARVGIAGYGKLGGMELGYASDLDLVFLHDGAGAAADLRAQGRRQRGVLPAARATARAPAHGAHGGRAPLRSGRAAPALGQGRPRVHPDRGLRGLPAARGLDLRAPGAAALALGRGRCEPRRRIRAHAPRRADPGREARDAARGDRRDARAHARRARAARGTGNSTSSTIAAASPTSNSWPSTGCSGTCASTRRSRTSPTRSATSSRSARPRWSTTA